MSENPEDLSKVFFREWHGAVDIVLCCQYQRKEEKMAQKRKEMSLLREVIRLKFPIVEGEESLLWKSTAAIHLLGLNSI